MRFQKVRNGLTELRDQPGYFQVVIDGEAVDRPVFGFSAAMATFRTLKGHYPDGVESSGIARLLNYPQYRRGDAV